MSLQNAAPVGVTCPVSFAPDDLADGPITLEDFLPGYLVIDGESCFATPEEARRLFNWTESSGDSTPAPVDVPPLHFLDDLPDSTSSSEQHRWLESHGFELDDSMHAYSHSITPCPACDSSGHALFGRWPEDSATPAFWCQKSGPRPDWTPTADAPPAPEIAGGLPMEEDADPPPAGTASCTKVSSIEELKTLPRWIGVKGKRPLRYRPNNDPTKPLKGSTFSHPTAEHSKCGGFVDGISAESFVRNGGTCLNHVSISDQWNRKESRFQRMKRTTPEFQSMGWAAYGVWESFLEQKSGGYEISYCPAYNDAPKIVVIDIDYPKSKKPGEELEPAVVEAADAARDLITERLTTLGCPTCPSVSGKGRRAAFTVADPDFYQRKHLIWRHPIGVNVEINPPGVARHVQLYTLDGDLPELDPVAVDALLIELHFTKDTPKDRYVVQGPKGLRAFLEVADREAWALHFNEMSGTPFCGDKEMDDVWIHEVRSLLELRYKVETVRVMPKGGTALDIKRFMADEKLVARWGLEGALLRNRFHPAREWLEQLPQWGGTERINNLLERCLNGQVAGDDTKELVRTASADIVMSVVARALAPGCGWPRLASLWGPQGCGKTTLLKNLLPPERNWYYESRNFPLSEEQLFNNTRTKLLIEFSDPSTRRSEAESAKSFVSATDYILRHKYDRLSTHHRYNFGMAMTGNDNGNTFLPPDASGYRRYLAVDCHKVMDYEELTGFLDANRVQIFAEGLHRYNNGERFREIPDELFAVRDAAEEEKTGTGHLDSFFAMILGLMEQGWPEEGYALYELVGRFLQTPGLMSVPTEASPAVITSFVNSNAVSLSAGLIGLGLEMRKKGKAKVRRWFLPMPRE